MSTPRKTTLNFEPKGAMNQPARDIKDYEARIINKALEDDIKARMPDLDQNRSGISDTTTGNTIMQTIKDLAKDPRTYSTLANIGSIYAATQDDPTTASALSNVASRIDTGIQQKQAAEATVEAETIKAEADAESERIKAEADAESERIKAEQQLQKDIEDQNREIKKAAKSQENVLRKEFSGLSKEYRKVIKQKDKLLRSLQRETAAGDLSAIFSYMKILDPESVVREGEQATAKNAAGISDRIRNLYNAALKGVKLTPEQRIDFGETSQQLMIPYIDEYRGLTERYEGIAKRQNLNPLNILGEKPPEIIKEEQRQIKKQQQQEEDIQKNTVGVVTEIETDISDKKVDDLFGG